MTHLTDGECSDFVRGLVRAELLADVQGHLSLCTRCRDAVAFYGQVRTAAFVPSLALPGDAVALAKSLFEPLLRRETLKQAIAKLIMPPAEGWALAGVRSAIHSGAAKHAVYEWGDFSIDLRAEVQPETIRMSLVGQLANQSDPQSDLESVPVRLMAGKKTVEYTACNHLGEFALSFAPGRRLHLEIDLEERQLLLKVPLKRLSPEEGTK